MIRIKLAALALAALTLAAAPARAQDAGPDKWALDHAFAKWTEHCQNTTQYEDEMRACFEGGIAQIEADLEETFVRWQNALEDDLPRYRDEHAAVMNESYRTRLRLGELECEDENFAVRDGSGYATIHAHCLLGKRIEHLRYLTGLAEYY